MAMIPKTIDSLGAVEVLMRIEEVFEIEFPDSNTKHFGSADEIISWLEVSLSGRRPNKHAIALLRKLAKGNNNSELTKDLDGTWRREQIAVIINDLFHL